ncbi:MAG: hypothetical protein LIP12_14500 [Clostridiales bacterium]|nr:hypothetical protein [Clostridiales bacterium]
MKLWNHMFVVVPLCTAVILLLAAPMIYLFQYSKLKNKRFWLAAYVLILIWIARFLVGYLIGFVFSGESSGLSAIEELLNSLIHALQTFSMDEDYTDYTVKGKQLLTTVGLSHWAPIYGLFMSLLNLCAPILGGAILLDILMNLFPKFRLRFLVGKDVFVFSELNDASITLAEDICAGDHFRQIMGFCKEDRSKRRPVLVFTDTYNDENDESGAELIDRAKALGAICVREDMMFLSFRSAATVSYFLLDSSYQGSMNALDTLLKNDGNGKPLWPSPASEQDPVSTRVYLFSEDGNTNSMIRNLRDRYKENADRVMIRNVRSCRNAVVNLMYDTPLFLSLFTDENEKAFRTVTADEEETDLTVTILGDNQLAQELFKASYWCGQMNHIRLHLNVLARDPARFEQRIRQECPELQSSCDEDSDLLRVFPNDPDTPRNPPYAYTLRFIQIKDTALLTDLPEDLLGRTDYFAVAFDSDQENLEAADCLSQRVTHLLLESFSERHPVIAVSVFDRVLSDAAARLRPEPFHPYLIPFADRQSRFNCKNVFITDFSFDADASGILYDKTHEKKEQEDEYKFWANIARTVHVPYKMFGIGAIEEIRLNGCGVKSGYRYRKEIPYNAQLADALAWIEHRRWNAFMRAQGFCHPTKNQLTAFYKNPALTDAAQKYLGARLHSCLTESSLIPTKQAPWPDLCAKSMDGLDYVARYLDLLEIRIRKQADGADAADTDTVGETTRNLQPVTDEELMSLALHEPDLQSDYKKYDYPAYDDPLRKILGWPSARHEVY